MGGLAVPMMMMAAGHGGQRYLNKRRQERERERNKSTFDNVFRNMFGSTTRPTGSNPNSTGYSQHPFFTDGGQQVDIGANSANQIGSQQSFGAMDSMRQRAAARPILEQAQARKRDYYDDRVNSVVRGIKGLGESGDPQAAYMLLNYVASAEELKNKMLAAQGSEAEEGDEKNIHRGHDVIANGGEPVHIPGGGGGKTRPAEPGEPLVWYYNRNDGTGMLVAAGDDPAGAGGKGGDSEPNIGIVKVRSGESAFPYNKQTGAPGDPINYNPGILQAFIDRGAEGVVTFFNNAANLPEYARKPGENLTDYSQRMLMETGVDLLNAFETRIHEIRSKIPLDTVSLTDGSTRQIASMVYEGVPGLRRLVEMFPNSPAAQRLMKQALAPMTNTLLDATTAEKRARFSTDHKEFDKSVQREQGAIIDVAGTLAEIGERIDKHNLAVGALLTFPNLEQAQINYLIDTLGAQLFAWKAGTIGVSMAPMSEADREVLVRAFRFGLTTDQDVKAFAAVYGRLVDRLAFAQGFHSKSAEYFTKANAAKKDEERDDIATAYYNFKYNNDINALQRLGAEHSHIGTLRNTQKRLQQKFGM